MDIDPGTVVANRYRISRPLGRGGMGEVFAAENIRTGRPVAVKLLRSESKAKSSAVARFRREARAAGSINSDHVTEILDVEEDAEHGIVLVFELLEGESLIDRLKRTGPIPFDELHSIVEQVWIGLADAHKAGIIHRDLKPSNVFLEHRPDGQIRVKILDFGISKLPKEMGGETLTEMGQSLGTFSFMPPEQIGKAKTVDHRADIYASATLIYQALSGQLPYAARNILVMVEMKSKTDPRKLADAMGDPVDPRLEAFLAKSLARDPADRYQSANEALQAWRELRNDQRAPQSSGSGQHQLHPQQQSSGGGQHQLHQQQQQQQQQQQPSQGRSPQSQTLAMPHLSPLAPVIHTPPVPMMSEPTSDTGDTAATLAIPISSLNNAELLRNRAAMSAGRQGPQEPLKNLNRTMPLATGLPNLALEQQIARNSSFEAGAEPSRDSGGAAVAYAQRAAAAMPGPPVNPASGMFAIGGAQPRDPTSQHGVPKVYEEQTANAPPSQDQTQIYQPSHGPHNDKLATRPPQNQQQQHQQQQQQQQQQQLQLQSREQELQRRSAAPFILGAIAFAVVGFGIVALVMNYYWR